MAPPEPHPFPWPWETFELAGVMLLVLGPEGRVVHVNARGAETLARPTEEIVGKDWFATFLPERIRRDVRQVFGEVMSGRTGAPATHENAVLRPDGSERIIAWRNALVRDPQTGRVVFGISSGEDVTDLRRTEAALRESEARFRATFEQAAVGMAHVGFDGCILRANDTLCAIVGYERAELERLTIADVTHPDDYAADLSHAQALLAGQTRTYRLEKRYIRKDGSSVWASLTASIARDADGVPQHFLSVVEDISDKKAAQALLRNEELQRMALAAAQAGAWEWHGNTDAEVWSPETFRLFGLEETAGAPSFRTFLERCVDPRDRGRFESEVERLIANGGGRFAIDFRSHVPERGLRWMTTAGLLTCDGPEDPVFAYGLVADITLRRNLEDALRESEERLRLATTAAGIGVWEWDVVADEITWSDVFVPASAAATNDRPPRRLAEWLSHVHPEDRAGVEIALRRALSGEAPYALDLRMVTDSGQVIWIRTRGTVLRDADGAPQRVLGVDLDVTNDRTAQDELGRLARELDHRARNVFALVQAIASQTLSRGHERTALLQRLSALIKAHGIAARGGTSELGVILGEELAPFDPLRVVIHGPAVALSSRATTAFAMVFHELATNAAKYGALSGDAGRLAVDWTIGEAERGRTVLRIGWTETAAHEVEPPERRGFGSAVVKGSIEQTLGGVAEIVYRPMGLTATLTVPLAAVAAEEPTPVSQMYPPLAIADVPPAMAPLGAAGGG